MLVHRWEEAERYLIQAIEICGRTTPASGAFMGSLAMLYAQQSKIEQARKSYRGKPLVAVYQEELGKFLCKQAKVLHMVGESDRLQRVS